MRITISALLMSTLVVSGCATKANPFNWFAGSSRTTVAPAAENTNPLIPERTGLFKSSNEEVGFLGQPMDSVSSVVIERIADGIIIRVTGLAARQGFYAVQLTPGNAEQKAVDGVLTYRLEGLQGPGALGGPTASREIIVARKVSNQTLQGTRTIRVEARNNSMTARR
ncbi:hypothetical protein ROLI_023970 [Roseobacter fucihabitans]|uniref:Lipoprotein n=1 Tax=Roseobacter fucihabitans TaxID=1537242 RepID=A0ABZ2BTQ6_9RHOB|nr:hypothetical protein [Roseobacter litoralis]MBC6965808.1 hypothetical protein [Roseobacter litoralis]